MECGGAGVPSASHPDLRAELGVRGFHELGGEGSSAEVPGGGCGEGRSQGSEEDHVVDDERLHGRV